MASRGVNACHFIGHLGKDCEIRALESNGQFAISFSIACNRSWLGTDGQQMEATDWINVVKFDKSGNVATYLKKGKEVYVEGRQQTRTYDDANGVKQYRTEIVAREIQLLGGNPGNSDGGPSDSNGNGHPAAQRPPGQSAIGAARATRPAPTTRPVAPVQAPPIPEKNPFDDDLEELPIEEEDPFLTA